MSESGPERAPSERLTVEEAMAIRVRTGAYASFEERRKETITPGTSADVWVLGWDPRTVEPAAIDQVTVLVPYVGVNAAYEASPSLGKQHSRTFSSWEAR